MNTNNKSMRKFILKNCYIIGAIFAMLIGIAICSATNVDASISQIKR